MTSNLSAFPYIAERSEGTPGLWNYPLSILSANIKALDTTLDLGHFQQLSIGSTPPSYATTAAVTIEVSSAYSDYLYLVDSSGQKSSYIIGSRAGGLADGLNIWDASAGTMIASFSKQSIRFFQQVVGPVFDTGGALTDTLNAATFGTAADSVESRIQAAISAASAAGITRVYVPASLYPYSAQSVSFDTRVQMVREGGDWTVYDVIAYGGNGNGSIGSAAGNSAAVQSAISGANADPHASGLGGGVVYVPPGRYVLSRGLRVPVAVNSGQVILRGAGMRVSYFYPQTSTVTAVLFGSPVPDIGGSSGSYTQYCGWEDLSMSGSLLTDRVCAIQFTEMQKGWIRNAIIENFATAGSIGLYLRGSTSASVAPHNWRCGFQNVLITTTRRPLLIENGDENDFYNCNFNLASGATSAQTAVQIVQGRNNRFFGLLVGGDSADLTARMFCTGVKFETPASGDNANHQFYGVVTEGLDSGFSIAAGVLHTAILYHNSSINSVGIRDLGTGTTYLETGTLGVPLYQFPAGAQAGPSYAIRSEGSLGFYRSAASTLALSYGTLLAGSGRLSAGAAGTAAHPGINFAGQGLGLIDAGSNIMGIVGGATAVAYVYANQFNWATDGTALQPISGYNSERSLGLYRSGASILAVSYGQLSVPPGSVLTAGLAFSTDTNTGFYLQQADMFDATAGGIRTARFGLIGTAFLGIEVGSQTSPGLQFNAEPRLGIYRSGVSTMAISAGTFNLADNAVRFSMRTLAASSITASAAKTNVAVNEVVFTIGGASGASFAIYSGGTVYGFDSIWSAKAT